MSKDDYRIWSNADLDYEEWKDWMEEEYPTFSDDERVAMMYEENGHYLEDERLNLDIQLSQPILVVGDLGLWNGRDTKKFPAAMSGTAFTLITTTPHGMWTETEISGAMTPTMTARTTISIGCIRTMFPRHRKTDSKKKSTTAQPPEQISSVSPADLAMKSERCTAGAFLPDRENEVKRDEPSTAERKLYCQTGLFGFQRKSMQQR